MLPGTELLKSSRDESSIGAWQSLSAMKETRTKRED